MDNNKTQQQKETQLARKVLAHAGFRQMAKQKSIFGWGFSAIIFFIYVAFIWVIGTRPQLLATPISPDSITTWGIYIGIFVIVFSFLITLVYVSLANGKFEQATQAIVQEVTNNQKGE